MAKEIYLVPKDFDFKYDDELYCKVFYDGACVLQQQTNNEFVLYHKHNSEDKEIAKLRIIIPEGESHSAILKLLHKMLATVCPFEEQRSFPDQLYNWHVGCSPIDINDEKWKTKIKRSETEKENLIKFLEDKIKQATELNDKLINLTSKEPIHLESTQLYEAKIDPDIIKLAEHAVNVRYNHVLKAMNKALNEGEACPTALCNLKDSLVGNAADAAQAQSESELLNTIKKNMQPSRDYGRKINTILDIFKAEIDQKLCSIKHWFESRTTYFRPNGPTSGSYENRLARIADKCNLKLREHEVWEKNRNRFSLGYRRRAGSV